MRCLGYVIMATQLGGINMRSATQPLFHDKLGNGFVKVDILEYFSINVLKYFNQTIIPKYRCIMYTAIV